MVSKKRARPTTSRPIPVINSTSMYALGMLYGKGNIIFHEAGKKCELRFGIQFKRPTVDSKRPDNLKPTTSDEKKSVTITQSVFNEFIILQQKFSTSLGVKVSLELLPDIDGSWKSKTIFLKTEKLATDSSIILQLFETNQRIDSSILQHVPNYLFNAPKANVEGFLQGIADSSGLPPSTTTSLQGIDPDKSPRLQFELVHDRSNVPIEICRLFQRRLGIPIQGINWGHPSIRGVNTWKTQNHQFRIFASDVLAKNFNFRLKHKKESLSKLIQETTSSSNNERKFYPDGTRGPKKLPLTIRKRPFNDPDLPEVLQNLHFGSFGIKRKKLENANKYKFTQITDEYTTYEKEQKLFREKKKGVKADAAAFQIYEKLKQKSYPLGPNSDYND